MMRLSALSRVAWKLTGLQLAAAVGRKSSIAKAMKKTKGAEKRSASRRVTSRRRGASPASSRESMMGAAGPHLAVVPPGVSTKGVARAGIHVADLHKLGDITELVSSAVCLTGGGRETRASASSLPLSMLPASALPSSSPPPPPPPVPNVKGCSVSVTRLQRRIRSLLAQLVLLSPEPLQPSALFARYRSAVDEETASMCAWAAHAVYEYDHGLLRCGGRVASHAARREALSEGEAGAYDAEQRTAGPTESNADSEGSSSGGGAAAEQRVLWKRGQQLSQAFRASVVPLVATLCGDGSCGGTEASVALSLPASHEVEQWMFLSIIFSDSEFRVSPYSGAVSYPALPSMLLATVDPVRDRAVAKLCYALQWGVQAKTAAYAAFRETNGNGGAKYLSGTTSRKHEQQPSVPPATAREEAVTNTCEFVWLNGAAGSPTWTTAHAQYLLHSALTSARKPLDESLARSAASTTEFSADQQLRKTISAAAALQHTSGHPLVDVMLQASSVVSVATRSGSSPTGEADLPVSGDGGGGAKVKTTRGAAAAAAHPPALGWNEGKKGTDVAKSFAMDASEDGLFATLMGDLPTRSLSAGAMYEINRRLIGHLFRRLAAIPISVARLSTVVRWNLSVTHAAYYRSFFRFLLLTAANPMVRRMADGRRQRRHANAVCADVWGGKEDDSVEVRGGVEDEVRNALAQYDPHTFKGLLNSSSAEGSAVAALRRALVADADVTKKCDHIANTVMEVMCVRVLPHARPGRGSATTAAPRGPATGAAAAPVMGTTFCGYPLRYVEVLPTWRQTPEEVLQYLWRQQDEAPPCGKDTNWLECNEEPYILVFSLDRGVLHTRLRLVVDRYLELTNGAAASAVSPHNAAAAQVTLHELGLMTLWAHEYGAEMAAELLFVHLLPRHEEVRLHPPRVSGPALRHEEAHKQTAMASGDDTGSSGAVGYGAWTVEFVPALSPDPRRGALTG
ncbi:conserved hypothetical protein [Leishmania infantum JPCM5]|uniref:Uncharacterized protein n=2 Tax=Leishmania infantum TaxID=5671 RepID=A4HWI3_LEIIN|nr:conserved hypothetical protein [Leishmania infantum JPCM5]CAC9472553.1 hypothetical_protein_-_conserved [Leishmania infantum]CAM66811.1 conserved hypothetical protein [Leishmania infantum JPCM5]SUZ40505.1 hypothetical_protein_-_conserved [Leishmania infantum]|eukprot:XP_001464424.1 conserved hypothetical protein [Leishmania infantum JPCM5]